MGYSFTILSTLCLFSLMVLCFSLNVPLSTRCKAISFCSKIWGFIKWHKRRKVFPLFVWTPYILFSFFIFVPPPKFKEVSLQRITNCVQFALNINVFFFFHFSDSHMAAVCFTFVPHRPLLGLFWEFLCRGTLHVSACQCQTESLMSSVSAAYGILITRLHDLSVT